MLSLLVALLPLATVAQDDEPAPQVITGAADVSGEVGADDVLYQWEIGQPATQWRIELQGPPGQSMQVDLSRSDGDRLERIDRTSGSGLAYLNDLALDPGTWFITVVRRGDEGVPFELRTLPEPESFDPEPNDAIETAAVLEDGDVVRGRLGRTDQDEDLYRLTVPATAAQLRDITLEWSGESGRRLCLRNDEDRDLKCAAGQGSAELLDLLFEPGDHYVSVSGSEDAAAPYELAVVGAGPPARDYEAEPNDDDVSASPFRAELGVRGRSSREDVDFHRVDIETGPQLWQVRATGAELDRLSWVRGGQEVLAATPDGNGMAQLTDLYLVPGRHVFRVRALGGEYRLEMKPLGPPDPAAEHEPNNEDVRAEPYGVGDTKIGRLVTGDDVDRFRFTLAAPDHVRINLDQPADADLALRLHDGGGEFLRARAPAPGEAIDLDLWLRPGDYLLTLAPRVPSQGRYELTSERLDPFALAVDQEPNDHQVTARQAPHSLRWEGRADFEGDVDATWLPPLASVGPVTIRLEGERPRPRLYAGEYELERLSLEEGADGAYVAPDAPVGVPLYLEITATSPYSVVLEAPGWSPRATPADPPVELSVELSTDTVAAYWPGAQWVDGAIRASNTGDQDLSLDLEVLSSHYGWRARPETPTLDVPAGATREVPLRIDVRPDAWAGVPVRVSVAGRDAEGGLVTAATTLEARPDATPVNATVSWDVPAALVGGLDVAALSIGGEPLGSVDADREPLLYDGVTPAGAGFSSSIDDYPIDFIVDLAGETPVPVRGTIINPLAQNMPLSRIPDQFELLLSSDGVSWQTVLSDELQPLPIDQAFVLEAAVPATQAMLRIHTDHGDDRRSNAIVLGEWKVVAEPGATPDPMPTNIADPVRGGHVVRQEPFANSLAAWYQMLDEESRRQGLPVERNGVPPDDRFELVLGFQDGRAAQITALRWHDPDASDEATRLQSVEVAVSVDGPLGPWQPLGEWALTRAADGSVTPFDLDEPAWARYVLLSSPLDPEARVVEAPGRVEVLERATGEEYRSILAEWGYTSRQGPYEWLVTDPTVSQEPGPDAGDTRETATALDMETPRTDRAAILEDVDWYHLEVPADANSLTLDVAGVPVPDVRLTLFDASGAEVPMPSSPVPGGMQRYEASVDPGSYDLLVEQVPFNVAFTFDTSGSMGPFLDFVLEGMRAFAADVQPGREVVTILPFGYGPLLDSWQDQPDVLEDAVNNWTPGGKDSSNAEQSLLLSMEELATREGTRAILVVTDAESGSFDVTPELWSAFGEVAPVVYSVHVGASNEPFRTRNLMRSWADANAGHYAFPATHAEMEQAFERMSTRLRRPATYTLAASAEFIDRTPGTVEVVSPPDQPVGLAPDSGIGIVLDTSGSMRTRLEGERRIDIAKASLRELLGETIREGTPVAIRSLGPGGRKWKCRSRLEVPLAPLDRKEALAWAKQVKAPRKAGTPLTDALERIPEDLEGVDDRIVVVITDGNESCGGDPLAAARQLERGGISAVLNIVGFALDDEELRAEMATWAEETGGSYFDAASGEDLLAAIKSATGAPYVVIPAAGGEVVASGTVGGEPVTVPPGAYVVEVRSDQLIEVGDVVVAPGADVTVELPASEE